MKRENPERLAPHEAGGARRLPVQGVRAAQPYAADDWVAEEVPVALEYNGVSHAVMLATPLDLDDFALGFSLSEGIVRTPREFRGVESESSALGITLHIEIGSEAYAGLKQRRRTLAGRTGCGLCGTESLEQVARDLPAMPSGGAPIEPAAIARAMRELAPQQTLQRATGAVHAAAWATRDGAVRWLREDIGRHNALDKLIGALAAHAVDAADGFVVVTSRASFEMVQKTAMAGVPLLAAVSAPTAYAVATAQRARMALVGFARGDDLVVYAGAERLAPATGARA